MTLRLYNTASREIEEFTALHPPLVTMYNCGPTVYNHTHIGNLRSYLLGDLLRRVLEHEGYAVKQVMNITDVGHLVSDTDEGEDKIELGAKREGKTVEEIVAMYSNTFYKDIDALNILRAQEYPRATEHIPEQIALIKTLGEKGYTYTTHDGVYFDTSKFPRYTDFARLDIEGMKAGARVDIGEKKNPTDFALWKFFSHAGEKRQQEWESPWGVGFPGWHIECSAMAIKYLGETIDIHTGGIDHIPVHHSNEIAQSECATEKLFAHFWLHGAFMTIEGQKMSKSLNNTYTLADLAAKGISPLGYRYWLLTAHYRTQVNFTWEALLGANEALERLKRQICEWGNAHGTPNEIYLKKFSEYFRDDLDTPRAIALLWEMVKDATLSPEDKRATTLNIDHIFGLKLHSYKKPEVVITLELAGLLEKRNIARKQKNWAEADHIRDEIKKLGYEVRDILDEQRLEPTSKI